MSILKPNWNHKDIDSRKMKFFESKYNLRLESMKTNQKTHLMSNMHVDAFNLQFFDTDLSYDLLDSYFKKIDSFSIAGYKLDYATLTRTATYVEDLENVCVSRGYRHTRNHDDDQEELPVLIRTETWFIEEVETFIIINVSDENPDFYRIYTQYRTSPISLLDKLLSASILTSPNVSAPEPKIGLLVSVGDGLDVATTTMEVPLIEDINIPYGRGFDVVSDTIVETIKSKDKTGLMIFHGEPGTGKTSYIKWLSGQTHRRFIYIPSYMVRSITDPSFMSLFLRLKDTVFVIEDAEESLGPRVQGGNSIVSTLLNLTDGILANALNCQFICTFNTEIENIDSALLRPGRLLVRHEFKALDVEDVTTYLTHNGYDGDMPEESRTLAQLSKINDEILDNSESPVSANPIGFGFNSLS